MATQNSQIYFRYRLSDNTKSERQNINGIDLNKQWTTFPNEQEILKEYVRTKDNPENQIDYEKFDRITHAVIKSSWVDYNKFFPYYERTTLASMPRPQLEIICNSYNIVTANLRTDFLINKILQKQEIFKNYHDAEKERKRKELLEEIAEKVARKVIDEKLKESSIITDEKTLIEIKQEIIKELEEPSKEEILIKGEKNEI